MTGPSNLCIILLTKIGSSLLRKLFFQHQVLEEPSQLGRLQYSFHKRPLQDVVCQTSQTVVLPWYFFCAQRAISFANNTCLICDLVIKFRNRLVRKRTTWSQSKSQTQMVTVGGREHRAHTRVFLITTLVVSQYDMCHNKELHSSSSDVALNSFCICVVF